MYYGAKVKLILMLCSIKLSIDLENIQRCYKYPVYYLHHPNRYRSSQKSIILIRDSTQWKFERGNLYFKCRIFIESVVNQVYIQTKRIWFISKVRLCHVLDALLRIRSARLYPSLMPERSQKVELSFPLLPCGSLRSALGTQNVENLSKIQCQQRLSKSTTLTKI